MHYICWDIYAVNIYINTNIHILYIYMICTAYIHRYIYILYNIICCTIYIIYYTSVCGRILAKVLAPKKKKNNTFSPSPYQNVLQNSSSRMLNLLWQPAAFHGLIETSFKPGNHDQGTAAAFKPNTAAQHIVSLEETHSAFDKRTKGWQNAAFDEEISPLLEASSKARSCFACICSVYSVVVNSLKRLLDSIASIAACNTHAHTPVPGTSKQ